MSLGRSAGRQQTDAVRWASEHLVAVRAVAELYGLGPTELYRRVVKRLSAPGGRLRRELAGARSDRRRASLVGLAAALEGCGARAGRAGGGHPRPAGLAFAVEEIADAGLRDVLYSHFWRGRSIEEIADAQGLRPLTVRQNLKRALRQLGEQAGDGAS